MKSPRKRQQPKGDYPVGYARPPEHTRFPHQKNPNRNGRRKKDFAQLLHEALYRSVLATGNGRRRRMPRLAVFAENLAQWSCQGDARARRDLIALMNVFPHVVKPPRPYRKITPDMSLKEAAAAYAEMLTPIPGVIDDETTRSNSHHGANDRAASGQEPVPPGGVGSLSSDGAHRPAAQRSSAEAHSS